MRAALLTLIVLASGFPAAASAEPVLLISIDGLRPGEVIEAEQRGLKIPNLRRFLKEGAYATGVTGVLPTVTYPSHATLLTGASPGRHGIVNNTTFDPTQTNQGGWYWYARDTRVPTLWDAAGKAGIPVGNVHWPVSVDAAGVRWNLPQLWRTGHEDDRKLVAALASPGLVGALETALKEPYAQGIDESLAGDENRGRFAVEMIRRHRPGFITVYLTAFDHEQHVEGPDTPAAHAVLERIDAIVGRLIAAQQAAHRDGVIAVASDHGFLPVTRELNLFRAFIDAGLIKIGDDGKIASWEAMPWPSGGSIAVALARPEDAALVARVSALLQRLQGDPANGIARLADAAQIAAQRANPRASFYLELAPGTMAAGYAGPAAPLMAPSRYKGMHGYFPDNPAMRSTFMLMGKGVPRARSLGEIDMRAIAPTLARILKVKLEGAEVPAVPL